MTDYELINTGINLLTGIGTVGAVVTALYLGRKQNQPRLIIDNRLYNIHGLPGIVSPEQVFVRVAATNAGIIRERVNTFGYSIGFFRWEKKASNIPSNIDIERPKFPATIEPGEYVSDYNKIETFNEFQLTVFADFFDELPIPSRLKRNKKVLTIFMYTARCWVRPSRGKAVSALPDKSFRNHIISQYQQKKEKN